MRLWTILATLVATACTCATADAQSATINMTGMEFRCVLFGPCWPNQVRNSSANPSPSGPAQLVPAATGYRYELNGVVSTSGLIADSIPTGSSLAAVLDQFAPGASRILTGYVRNPGGTLPTQLWTQRFADTISGINVGFDIRVRIDAGGVAYVEFLNIDLPTGVLGPLTGTIVVTSGTCNVQVWNPTAANQTEWHFDANLDAVAASGPSRLRYMDDPAFGSVLDGTDGSLTTPNATTPTGVTDLQSSFGTTTSFGIADINGQPDNVYKTSPARNTSAPGNEDWRRGVGLLLYPRTQPAFPGQAIPQWTMIWDLYIPASSWNTEYPVALIEDNHNNDGMADMLIRNTAFGGGGNIGYGVEPLGYLPTPLIAPDRWMRIAIVNNFPQNGLARVFVDGTFIGTTGSDWLYNTTNPSDPRFLDSEAVIAATWNLWGQFPNPWAFSTGGLPMASTLCLFADLAAGRSESVYVANMYFGDTMLTDTQIAALGGADADGILFTTPPPCPGDANGDGSVNGADLSVLLGQFGTSVTPNTGADFNGDGQVNGADLSVLLGNFGTGC